MKVTCRAATARTPGESYEKARFAKVIPLPFAVQHGAQSKTRQSGQLGGTHPNNVVMLANDQGWGDLSIHGNVNLQQWSERGT
jgi:hypothetical protein